jgi:hypothetical protein
MPLIDRSYFIGDLNIPGTDKVSIQERLDWFIENYETELLKDILGYQFYAAFLQGLAGSPVATIWTDLLQGVEYTDFNDRKQKWVGFVSQPLDLINAIDASNTITIIVGRGQQYDPVADATSVLLPASLIGKDFIIEQRSFGQLRTDEYSIVGGNTLQLSGGKKFSAGDTYFYKSATLALNTTTGAVKKSLIANYVYYQWQKDQYTQTVGLGEVATKAENAQVVTPEYKMIRAYNEMVERIRELMYYLYIKQDVYTDWWVVQQNWALNKYRKLNSLGI